MRRESSRILLIEILLLIVSFWGLFTDHFNLLLYLVLLMIPLITSLFILGVEKRGERLTKDSLLLLLIGSISYYLITYVMGYFTGFLKSSYSHNIGSIIYNVGLWSLFIVFVEVIRGMILKKGKYYKGLIGLSVVVFSILEIATAMNIFNISNKLMLFDNIFSIIIPIITKNILMTYIGYKTSYTNNIIYRFIMEIPIYIVPIIPDIGDYLRNLILILLPLFLIYWHMISFNKSRKITNSRSLRLKRMIEIILDIIIGILLIIIVVLVSGVFRFVALTIGSGSMTGTIDKGDVVIIDKGAKDYKEGDIVAFRKNNYVLVHRIVYVGENGYNTKGDYNKNRDNWLVEDKDIMGKYVFKIKYVGWLTVKVNEFLFGGD